MTSNSKTEKKKNKIKAKTSDRLFYLNHKEVNPLPKPIEPRILPLVKALNATRLVRTFSSCQGHFNEKKMMPYRDRSFADVRFHLLTGIRERKLQSLLQFLVNEFSKIDSPTRLSVSKVYLPEQTYIEGIGYVYVEPGVSIPGMTIKPCKPIFLITLTPANRFDNPYKKRRDTDAAIKAATGIVMIFNRRKNA